jgi:ankyrin repeat protein
MDDIWGAAWRGNLATVERLVGQDPGLCDVKDAGGRTPLVYASQKGHVGVVRWLLDQGAAINQRDEYGGTALWYASYNGRPPVVRLLLDRGADPAIAARGGLTPLIIASRDDHLEVVRSLLGHPSVKATINLRNDYGETALLSACYKGRGGVVRALLESGADPTIASNDGTTPTAIAKQEPIDDDTSAEGRRECVAVLEVRHGLLQSPPPLTPAC